MKTLSIIAAIAILASTVQAKADTYKLDVSGTIQSSNVGQAGGLFNASIQFDTPISGGLYLSSTPMTLTPTSLYTGGYNTSWVSTTNDGVSFNLSSASFINGASGIVDALILSGAPKADANPITIGLPNISSWSFETTSGGSHIQKAAGIINSYTLQDLSTGALVSTAPVPEPETFAMMIAGLGLLGLMARRRKV